VWILLAAAYLAICAGAASVLVTSSVCTQYGMAEMIPLAPLVLLFGLFIIFALAVSAVRDAGGLALFALLASVLSFSILIWPLRIVWRRLASGPILSLPLAVFMVLLAVPSALAALFFCLSMSV
jgi:hypothetical protein